MIIPFLSLVFLLFFCTNVFSQLSKLPPNPIPGRCYEKYLEYDKKVEWKEIDCTLANKRVKNPSILQKQEKIKLTKYQEKLKTLGYNVAITGIVDDMTINAHHRYLRTKKWNERREMRKMRSEKTTLKKKSN